ncbi:MAG TPA: WD40 repeat domain-containing protein [Gemmataceae bacterium]|nr:WD40 repeat domain-containing protein [Gemmataceae bacterium]
MNGNPQRLSLGLVGILLLITASGSGPGEHDKRDPALRDDPTKPFRTAIKGKVIAECRGHSGSVTGVAVSPDGKLAVSANWDQGLCFWSVPDGKLIRTIHAVKPRSDSGCTGPPYFSPNGKTVAALIRTPDEKSVKLCFWDAATGKELPRSVPLDRGGMWALSPDGERVARATDNSEGMVDFVRVWDTRKGKIVNEFRFRKEERVSPAAFSFSPDGKLLAVGMDDRGLEGGSLGRARQSVSSKVRIWELRTGKLVFASETLPLTREARWGKGPDGRLESVPEKQPYEAVAVAFSPDGTRLAAGGTDYDRGHAIWVWDLATRKLVQKLPVGDPFVSSLAFSPDGHMLACGTGPSLERRDPDIQIWNVTSAQLLGSLQKHTGTVTTVAWGKNGRTLVSCGQDRRVLIWRLEPR